MRHAKHTGQDASEAWCVGHTIKQGCGEARDKEGARRPYQGAVKLANINSPQPAKEGGITGTAMRNNHPSPTRHALSAQDTAQVRHGVYDTQPCRDVVR
jgi:hypothetical protein